MEKCNSIISNPFCVIWWTEGNVMSYFYLEKHVTLFWLKGVDTLVLAWICFLLIIQLLHSFSLVLREGKTSQLPNANDVFIGSYSVHLIMFLFFSWEKFMKSAFVSLGGILLVYFKDTFTVSLRWFGPVSVLHY